MSLLRPARAPRAAYLAACAALALQACASVPDLGPKPQIQTIPAQDLTLPKAEWPADAWWVAYDDPQLTALIEEALAGAPDMAQAAARIRKADALAQQAGAARLPSLVASGQAGASKRSTTESVASGVVPEGWNRSAQANLQLTFDPDLWGKARASLAAATSEAEATRADAANARLTLSTAIASAYADLARLHADGAAAEAALKARTATETLIQSRYDQGLETLAAVRRATSNQAAAQADLAAVIENLAIARNRIAALVGKGPERGMRIAAPQLSMTWRFGLPADLASGLIGRRPDIVAARLRTEAAAQQIKVAEADFYPSIRLSALIGIQALGLSGLSNLSSTYGSVGPAVSLPIFTGGALQGAYRGARADYDSAVAAYDATLVRALNEVADAAVSAAALAPRADRTRDALEAAQDAYDLTLARYRGGMATYLDVLSAEDALISARRSMAALETRAFSVDVALVKALGGGFRERS
jgi:NodT family efflux transporter outer membrane factor (OMF) lipoprotein